MAKRMEIEEPIASDRERADEAPMPFRDYYLALSEARGKLRHYLDESGAHRFFVPGRSNYLTRMNR